MKSSSREFILFVISGSVNTIVTYLLYAVLLWLANYLVAYTLSYIAGILFAYYLNSRWVFRQKMELKKALQYPLVYLLQYLLGIVGLKVLVDWFGISPLIAPWLVIVLTIPPTFLLSRWIIRPNAAHD